jgi:hypothetical protein
MSNPNSSHGGRRPGVGRPKSESRLLREAAEQLLRDLPHFRFQRQSANQVVEQLGRLTATVHRLREDHRSDRENLLPILRRLTEIECHLRLTEMPQAPRPSRRHPMGA